MKWTLSGEDITLHFVIKSLGQFAVPDTGSLKLTIRDNSGAVLAGYDKSALADITTSDLQLVVPAAINTVAADKIFESRYVAIDFSVGGNPGKVNASYRVSPFIPIQATTEDVLNYLGAVDSEVDPESIDLIEAYYALYADYGSTLQTAMSSGGLAAIKVNNAIALTSAILLLPSLPARMMQSETRETSTYQRKVDFVALQQSLESQLYESLIQMENALNGTPSVVKAVIPMAFTLDTDPVTNQ